MRRAVIYTRVVPNNQRVAKSDKLQAQEKRCRDFARKLNAYVTRVFKDEGLVKPPYFLRSMQSLFYYLDMQSEPFLVIADHPARIGTAPDVRKIVLAEIEKRGGKFISAYTGGATYIELYGAEVLETIWDMEF